MTATTKPLAPTEPPKKQEKPKESELAPAATVGKNSLLPVFVYGSLKKGYQLHDHYLKNQMFIGNATIKGYSLISLGQFPALIEVDDDSYSVAGEYYLVTQEVFDKLKAMEEKVGYTTEKVDGHFTADQRIAGCKDAKFKAHAWVFAGIQVGTASWATTHYQGQDWIYVDFTEPTDTE